MITLLATVRATSTTVTINAVTIAFVVGVIVPFITAVLTKVSAHPGLKGFVTLVLSGITGTVAVLTTNQGHAITVHALVLAIGSAWLLAVGSYLGLWKPTGAAPALHQATGRFGLGGWVEPADAPE